MPSKFKFQQYYKYGQPDHKKNTDISFLEWFIGFTEGDGSFGQTKLSFTINQKDPKLLFRIKKTLGFGSVLELSQPGIWRYSVTGQTNSLRLYYLFNDNLVLEKTRTRFVNWAKQLNVLDEVLLEQNPITLTLENAWLAGFIDAEGCFYARIRKKSQTKLQQQLLIHFSITQKGEKSLLTQILVLLKSKAKVQTFNQLGQDYNKVEVGSFESHSILLRYLNKYPCLGEKNIAFCIFGRIHGYQSRKEHLTEIGLERIRKLCASLHKFNQRG